MRLYIPVEVVESDEQEITPEAMTPEEAQEQHWMCEQLNQLPELRMYPTSASKTYPGVDSHTAQRHTTFDLPACKDHDEQKMGTRPSDRSSKTARRRISGLVCSVDPDKLAPGDVAPSIARGQKYNSLFNSDMPAQPNSQVAAPQRLFEPGTDPIRVDIAVGFLKALVMSEMGNASSEACSVQAITHYQFPTDRPTSPLTPQTAPQTPSQSCNHSLVTEVAGGSGFCRPGQLLPVSEEDLLKLEQAMEARTGGRETSAGYTSGLYLADPGDAGYLADTCESGSEPDDSDLPELSSWGNLSLSI